MHPIPRVTKPAYHPVWFLAFALTHSASGVPRRHTPFTRLVAPLIALAMIAGCTKQSGSVIDPSGTPPFMKGAAVYPDSVKMKSLPQSNGILTVTVRAQAAISSTSGSAGIAGVNAAIIPSGATDPLMTVTLHDDGVSPDSIAGDGIYSALIQFTIPRSASGVYILKFAAIDNQGLTSNTEETPLFMVRDSHAPVLSNLIAPDSVLVPVGGSATIPLYIRATDPDGQADIAQVYFRSLDSSDPTQKFVMNNDGSDPGSVPGDSTYAVIVKATDSPTVRKTYRFAFQAVNSFGDTSATILHSVTLY
jgi:hypothetical protein